MINSRVFLYYEVKETACCSKLSPCTEFPVCLGKTSLKLLHSVPSFLFQLILKQQTGGRVFLRPNMAFIPFLLAQIRIGDFEDKVRNNIHECVEQREEKKNTQGWGGGVEGGMSSLCNGKLPRAVSLLTPIFLKLPGLESSCLLIGEYLLPCRIIKPLT